MKPIFTIKGLAQCSVAGVPVDHRNDVSVLNGPLGVIVRIEGTPGSWYFMSMADCRDGNRRLSIDFGEKWDLDNTKEVIEAVSKEIGRLLELHVK